MNSRTTNIMWVAIAMVVALGIVGVGCRIRSSDDPQPTPVGTETPVVEPTSTLESAMPTPTSASTATVEPAPTEPLDPFTELSQDPETLMHILMQAGIAGDTAVGNAVIGPVLASEDQ